jgi:hypothetical protein
MKLGKNIEIDLSRQGNFIFALLLIHFVFFGFLCNIYLKDIGESVVFLYQVMFHPLSFLSTIILFAIIFFMVFRENFYEYGIRNSIWTVPFIIVESWVWYQFVVGVDPTIIGWYFLRVESYITIISLFGIILAAAISGAIAKEQYKAYLKKRKPISV